MNVKSSGFFCICSKKCLTASLYLKIFPAWDCFSPTVGTDQSQCGNKLFPSWESDILRFFLLANLIFFSHPTKEMYYFYTHLLNFFVPLQLECT